MMLLDQLNEKLKKLPTMVEALISAIEKAGWDESKRNSALKIVKSLQYELDKLAEPRYLCDKFDFLKIDEELNPYNDYKPCPQVCTKTFSTTFSFDLCHIKDEDALEAYAKKLCKEINEISPDIKFSYFTYIKKDYTSLPIMYISWDF